ncbi:MAG: type II secretion system protein [Thermodesulfobacteriota bacterium]
MTAQHHPFPALREQGFTLVEMVVVIVLLAILSVTAYLRWPSGLEEAAAAREFKRAVRYAQHKAMTRQFTTSAVAWGITLHADSSYSVERLGGSEQAEAAYVGRCLNSDDPPPCEMPLSGGSVYFNGLGEPLDGAGTPLATTLVFTIGAGSEAQTVTVHPQTGYVE